MKPGRTLTLAIALVVLLGLGSVAGVLWIGGSVGEQAVADASHEHGLRYDRERAVASSLGLRAAFDRGSLAPGRPWLDFTLADRAGRPVEGGQVRVSLHRPAGGAEPRSAEASSLGGGRYRAELGFSTPGFWDVRLDVVTGGDRVGLVQQVRVEAAGGPCQLALAPCTVESSGLALTLDLGRNLVTMKDLPVTVLVRREAQPVDGAEVEVAFAMKDMSMGENRVQLAPAGAGRYAGTGVLVRCPSGRRGWIASLTVRSRGNPPASASFEFTVSE
jgi:nitrogen fixation protein FixH